MELKAITAEEVEHFLRALDRGDDTSKRVLLGLNALSQRMEATATPPSDEDRATELLALFIEIIKKELAAARISDNVDRTTAATLPATISEVQTDATETNVTRAAWSILYARHFTTIGTVLRSKLMDHGLTQSQYYSRIRKGYGLLADCLRKLESQANSRERGLPEVSRRRDRTQRTPTVLPPQPAHGIFGRERTLTDLTNSLRLHGDGASVPAPLVLHGLPGMGKTTLAAALGAIPAVREHFVDGILWTALGQRPTVRILLEQWGDALGVDLRPISTDAACSSRLQDILSDRHVLLLVDDVWSISHFDHFKVHGPQGRLVATTRETPIAYGITTKDRALRVDVLEPDDAFAMLQALAPDVVQHNEAVARTLCERLDFVPLAIRLAGVHLAIETDVPERAQRVLGELIERRQTRLNLTLPEGHSSVEAGEIASVRSILAVSVNRLDKIDRERFAMASVFGSEPLTWDIGAAAAVWMCSREDAEDTIARFIQRSLAEPRGNRYWMHALLADYAAELLDDLEA